MEHNETQEFEHFEEYNDEDRYEEFDETIDNLVEEMYDEHLHEELAEKKFDEVALDEVTEQTEPARPAYLESVENNPYEYGTDEHAERGMKEELPEKSVDEVVLHEATDHTELAQPKYLGPVESNSYEDRKGEYANREMIEVKGIEVPEDVRVGERFTEIDTKYAEQGQLEQSVAHFGKNESSYQRNKKFDTPWNRSGPRLIKKAYDQNKSQKQNIGAKWVNPDYLNPK